jgi:hypothetical protein
MLHALRAFILSRPGLEPGNYGSYADYRQESAEITRDRDDALALLHYVGMFASDMTPEYFNGGTGRLTWDKTRGEWEYCTGQYYPVEYRAAAARLLSSALWNYWRDAYAMRPEPITREEIQRIARNAFRSRRVRKYFN